MFRRPARERGGEVGKQLGHGVSCLQKPRVLGPFCVDLLGDLADDDLLEPLAQRRNQRRRERRGRDFRRADRLAPYIVERPRQHVDHAQPARARLRAKRLPRAPRGGVRGRIGRIFRRARQTSADRIVTKAAALRPVSAARARMTGPKASIEPQSPSACSSKCSRGEASSGAKSIAVVDENIDFVADKARRAPRRISASHRRRARRSRLPPRARRVRQPAPALGEVQPRCAPRPRLGRPRPARAPWRRGRRR